MISQIENNEVGSSVRSKLNAAIDKVNEHLEPEIYRALLTQSGTGAPEAAVLENTLGGAIVWARTTDGIYTGTLAGAFPAGKTFLLVGNVASSHTMALSRLSDNVLALETRSVATGTAEDDVMTESSVQVLVYP